MTSEDEDVCGREGDDVVIALGLCSRVSFLKFLQISIFGHRLSYRSFTNAI